MKRLAIERTCEYDDCSVGRTVIDLDSLPSHRIEAAARALSVEICGYDESDDEGCMAQHRREAESAIRAFLETENKEEE